MKKYVATILLALISIIITGLIFIIVSVNHGLAAVYETGLVLNLLLAILFAVITGMIFDFIILKSNLKNGKSYIKTSVVYWGIVTILSRTVMVFQTGMLDNFSISILVSLLTGFFFLFGTGCIFGFFFWRIYTSTYERLNKA